MKKRITRDILLLLFLFVISRIFLEFVGVRLDFTALFSNWQYLDIYTLQHNLLRGVWYDHTQPPVFNIFLGIVLKVSGNYSYEVFTILFKLITLVNTFLLYYTVKKNVVNKYLPVVLAGLYLLSPATMIFENELFYTTFITMMLLTSCFFLSDLSRQITLRNAVGFFLPLLVICLTRSMYHLVWLFVISIIVLIYYKRGKGIKILAPVAFLSLALTFGWYLKNYFIFKNFSTSSWIGMNIARNVFHDNEINDSSKIESITPFSKISSYNQFLSPGYSAPYAGLNDRDLLTEMKNDSFINTKNVGFLQVSKLYMTASIKEIKANPSTYIKNVVQSAIIYFTPATLYPTTAIQAKKLGYYDVIYSFNLSPFANTKHERRVALTLSAIPKMIIYLIVIFSIVRGAIRRKYIPVIHLFILATIGYIFSVSSLFEHYENMRFRYEAEPLFLILLAFVAVEIITKLRQRKADRLK